MGGAESISSKLTEALNGLLSADCLRTNQIVVIGCSTSEIVGKKIGSASDVAVAESLMDALLAFAHGHGLFLAIQCCEHLNRALVVEEECAQKYDLEVVSVVPYLHAGGALATVAMSRFSKPLVVESISGHAGIDIGDTLIGMHLRRVAVPLRLPLKSIGQANLTVAYTRPKLIGGERARYSK